MKFRTACIFAALAASVVMTPVSSEAASVIRARFSFDAVASCQKPAIQNFPVHAEGTGTLSTDRTATLELQSNVEGRTQYSAKLGARPTEAIGGSASLRVAGRHTLKAVREYPNNYIIVYMTVIGNACALRIENRLKRGARQYVFTGNAGVAYCSKPRIVSAGCTPY